MLVGTIYDEREEERENAYNEGYQQGKKDIIVEITKKVRNELESAYNNPDLSGECRKCTVWTMITMKEILEQIKEQNND